MLHNMVSERYPKEEDDDASAFDSYIDEDEVSYDPASSFPILETSSSHDSSSHDRIVFGSFDFSIILISNPSIIPEFYGISIKMG
jgi:hypothetical protein